MLVHGEASRFVVHCCLDRAEGTSAAIGNERRFRLRSPRSAGRQDTPMRLLRLSGGVRGVLADSEESRTVMASSYAKSWALCSAMNASLPGAWRAPSATVVGSSVAAFVVDQLRADPPVAHPLRVRGISLAPSGLAMTPST